MSDLRPSPPTSMFASIPAGSFTMGTLRGQEDERPPHRVFVDGFELGVFPVTRAAYESFVDATDHERPEDCSHPPFVQPDLPVVGGWMQSITACGRPQKTNVLCACRRKPNGSMPPAGSTGTATNTSVAPTTDGFSLMRNRRSGG